PAQKEPDSPRGGSDTVIVVRPLRANVIRARVDGRIKGRIYCLQSDPESRSEDAACNAGGVHICRLEQVGDQRCGVRVVALIGLAEGFAHPPLLETQLAP